MRSIGAGKIIAMLFAVFISTILISGCAESKETQKPPGAGKVLTEKDSNGFMNPLMKKRRLHMTPSGSAPKDLLTVSRFQ